MSLLISLLLPMATSLLGLFVNGRKGIFVMIASSFVLLGVSLQLLYEVVSAGPQTLQFGNWPAPFGISFYADGLSAILVVLIALIAAVVVVFMSSWQNIKHNPAYFVLMQCLVASAIAVSLAADLFNLYVWFELMLIAVLGLIVIEGGRRQTEAALKYFAISMVGTLIMLAAIGLIHGAVGHLNYSALAELSAAQEGQQLTLYGGLLLIALLLKIGAFPLFAWLPAAYHALPLPLLALIGGLLTKLSVYVLMRLSGDVLDFGYYHEALGWIAVITMVSGVLGAAYHWDLRRILSFHIVSQVGFLLLGIALASPEGQTGTAFFLFHNVLVKANLLLIAGMIWMYAGHYDLRRIGGLYPARPLLAILFLVSAFSLVGVPPSSGFWGKLLIIMETLSQERYLWAAAALFTGLLTLYSMSKIWLEAFWKPEPERDQVMGATNVAGQVVPASIYSALLLLSGIILFMGLMPDPLIGYLENLH